MRKPLIISIAALALAAAFAGAVSVWVNGKDAEPIPSASQSQAPQARPVPAGGYKLPREFCPRVDPGQFNSLYPGKPAKPSDGPSLSKDQVRCSYTWDIIGDVYTLDAVMEIIPNNGSKRWYDGIKSVSEGVEGIAGLGDDAYFTATEHPLGPSLYVLHGNAFFEFRLSTLSTRAAPPADVKERLTNTALWTLTHWTP